MDSITAINAVRDSLRTNLTDPRTTAGDTKTRTWIYTDEPDPGTKYPRIQIKKLPSTSEVLSIGSSYASRKGIFLNVWFYSKDNFKIVVSGTTYVNEQLTEYYTGENGLIDSTLYGQSSTLFTAGAKSYKMVNSAGWAYNPNTQLYSGVLTIYVEFFTGCS